MKLRRQHVVVDDDLQVHDSPPRRGAAVGPGADVFEGIRVALGDAAPRGRITGVWCPVVFVAPQGLGLGADGTGYDSTNLWGQLAA
jgi:hypothetical protein